MSEKPIIFNSEMVKAILEGNKTQTRRICKPAKENDINCVIYACLNNFSNVGGDIQFQAPYNTGDTLWVKEDWRIKSWYPNDGAFDIEYLSDGSILNIELPHNIDKNGDIFNNLWKQSCDDYDRSGIEYDLCNDTYITPDFNPCRKRLSTSMPKWVARIWLEITDVRVDKLQNISKQDAINEGVEKNSISGCYKVYSYRNMWTTDPKISFRTLWDTIYEKDKSRLWKTNPIVWVYKFKKVEKF